MYKITITFTQVVPKSDQYVDVTETTEIYSQCVEDPDIPGIIAAVNKPPQRGVVRGQLGEDELKKLRDIPGETRTAPGTLIGGHICNGQNCLLCYQNMGKEWFPHICGHLDHPVGCACDLKGKR